MGQVLGTRVESDPTRSLFTSGRVITDRRSYLLPRTVEALVCTQSWLKNVCAIESNEVMNDIETAEDVEKAAEEGVQVSMLGDANWKVEDDL
ncbi:hypothetical protein Dimus_025408 [Dionaea muscipula]